MLGSPKQISSKISQFNDLNLSSQDSFVLDKKPQNQDEGKNIINSNVSSLNSSVNACKAQANKNKKKEKKEKMKMLIDQELLHHSFFLNKKKYKSTENLFFKNLDEKLHASNRYMQRYFNTRQKPIVHIKEIFNQKESKSPEKLKKNDLNFDTVLTKNNQQNQEQSPISNKFYVHYSLMNYSSMQDSDSILDSNKNTSSIANTCLNRKNLNSIMLQQIVTPFKDQKKLAQPNDQEQRNSQTSNMNPKRRVQSFQIEKQNSFDHSQNNTLDQSNIKYEQSLYYQTDSYPKKRNKSSFLIKTEINQNILKTDSIKTDKSVNQMSSTMNNKFLENKIKQMNTFSPNIKRNFLSQIQNPSIITKKELILNNNPEKLPLKYLSSKLKEINESISQKGRFFSNSLAQNKLPSQINLRSKQVFNLSVQGQQQNKIS